MNINDRNFNLEEILNSSDDSDIGYLVEVDFKYPYKMKYKTKNFHLLLKKILILILVFI